MNRSEKEFWLVLSFIIFSTGFFGLLIYSFILRNFVIVWFNLSLIILGIGISLYVTVIRKLRIFLQ